MDLVVDFYLRNQGILRKLTTRKCIAESYGLYVISKLKSIMGAGMGGSKVFNRLAPLHIKICYTICVMDGEHIDMTQGDAGRADLPVQERKSLLNLSFIPPILQGQRTVFEKCAIASVVFGGISLFSWVIIVIGLTTSVVGIVLSTFGFRSQHPQHARLGLILSLVGMTLSILYAYAAARGMIPYTYFTTDILN